MVSGYAEREIQVKCKWFYGKNGWECDATKIQETGYAARYYSSAEAGLIDKDEKSGCNEWIKASQRKWGWQKNGTRRNSQLCVMALKVPV